MKKKAIVLHSGGMDSSICLALAIQEFEKENVLSVSFAYNQRNIRELERAKKICQDWGVDHVEFDIPTLPRITDNALINPDLKIKRENEIPNTLVVGRNGLMARLGAIYADHLGGAVIYMGVLEKEEANSGYRDCSRNYMDKKQELLRLDLNNPFFEIRTPLVKMTKKETLKLADQLHILPYLLSNTITCYEGIHEKGCGICPACSLRNEGIQEYLKEHPEFNLIYKL